MSNRYEIASEWFDGKTAEGLTIQTADLRDTRDGHVYSEGAYRIVVAATGKPAKVGKGGTVPFYGESAWSQAESLWRDLVWAARYAS